MMTQIPYLQRWILLFVFYIFYIVFYIWQNSHPLLCFGHISTNERPDASFQVPLLHRMMYDVFTICKYFSTHLFEQAWYFQWKIVNCTSIVFHFSNKFLVKLFIFSRTRLHFLLSRFLIFYYILTIHHVKQHIKTSVGTRKFLSEFYLEVASIEFIMKLLSFVSFKRFSGVKIYKICDALLPLTQNLLLNPLSYCIPFFRLFMIQLFMTSNMILINFFVLKWLF